MRGSCKQLVNKGTQPVGPAFICPTVCIIFSWNSQKGKLISKSILVLAGWDDANMRLKKVSHDCVKGTITPSVYQKWCLYQDNQCHRQINCETISGKIRIHWWPLSQASLSHSNTSTYGCTIGWFLASYWNSSWYDLPWKSGVPDKKTVLALGAEANSLVKNIKCYKVLTYNL